MAFSHTLRRTTARTLVLDPLGRSLLLRSSDPFDRSRPPWWELPGGGIERDETPADAARRELAEETGIVDCELGPCVWTQEVRFTFAGMRFEQFEHLHVAWVPDAVEPRPRGLEALEAMAFEGHRWWEVEALTAADDVVYPERIREVLADVVGGTIPDRPIDITPHPPAG